MSSGASSHPLASQAKRTSFGGFQGSNAPHLLDRSRAALRGSTPDSEALASSDDEPDQLNRLTQVTSNPALKPIRRASWLTEGQQASNRKSSLGATGPFSPVSPGTAAPTTDQTPWGSNVISSSNSTMGRGHSSSTSFPWSNNIWNNDSQKGPPQRLTEVLPSPTTMVPPGSAGLYGDEALTSPRDNSMDPGIPFAIPLQPTPKTYRSQSYSVGQLDPEAVNAPQANYGGHSVYGRPRMGTSYAGLSHRPSRPSMLGEMSHDPLSLGQLQEVEDDEESLDLSDPGFQQAFDPARTIEQLTRENALLRQAHARDLVATSKAATNTSHIPISQFRQRSRDATSEGSDHAVYEADEADIQRVYRNESNNGRRFSEYGVKPSAQYPFAGIPENRTVESVKKGHWQSSLGFGGVGEPPQSRRHSFAEVPTRQNSVGSGDDAQTGHDAADLGLHTNGRHGSPAGPGGYGDVIARPSQGDNGEYAQFHLLRQCQERFLELTHLRERNFAVNYFSRMDPQMRGGEDHGPPSSTSLHQAYLQGQYGRPQQFGQSHHRPKQLLYIVTFKCQRADVFYVQEGTGLQVNKGDLVIVEADRGTDLGTVASDVVPWAEAKEAKDRFIEDHHKWLMMFSQHGQNGTIAGQNPNGQPNTAVIGNASGQHGMHDLPGGELKPKMIKRVAQQHEIQALREKEGAEAKAKRACQQKVVEHRLRMEILDAEFQMYVFGIFCCRSLLTIAGIGRS